MSLSDPSAVMAAVDAMSPAFRALVHEFGALIVSEMISDGYTDADELRSVLETWRDRRQERWLATNFVGQRVIESFKQAALVRGTNAA